MEEVRAHYEVAYAPTSSNYDGHFRTIEVRVHKSGIRLQSRKGYFALPMLDGISMAPFELAALTALNSQPSPHAFEFHAGVLTFHATAQATECRAVFSVPSRILHFTEDPKAKLFHLHVAFLALLKDDQDQVVRKISRDLPFQAPADRRAEFERGEVTVTLPLRLPPGRYHPGGRSGRRRWGCCQHAQDRAGGAFRGGVERPCASRGASSPPMKIAMPRTRWSRPPAKSHPR